MKQKTNLNLIRKIIWLRLAQILVNNRYKKGDFVIPIHLAMGHETIAVVIDAVMQKDDGLFLTHRNIHYNLARMGTLKEELDEYYLKGTGLAKGHLGSMNLSNLDKDIIYTSSILANNLSVGCGFALGNKVKKTDGVVFIVTGDGAIEEGAFYESLLFLKSNQLASIIIVENNEWSLATRVEERRASIDLYKMADSLGIEYLFMHDNDPDDYLNKIEACRSKAINDTTPILVEVKLTTLGAWYLKSDDYPNGKFINYHGGPAPKVSEKEYPMILSSNEDPLYSLTNYLSIDSLTDIAKELRKKIEVDVS